MPRFSISQPVRQVEAPRLVTGKGRYTDDVSLARQGYAVFLRSPHAHADVAGMGTTRAQGCPGVHVVLTGEDYAAEGLGEIEGISLAFRRDGRPMYRPPRPALARDRVRHIGQPVALVVADTLAQAKDAAEAIEVDYRPLAVQRSTAAANRPETPALWEDCPDNEPFFSEKGNAEAVDAALARAAHVVREKFVINRITANTMEPRAVVAEYDPRLDHYTIHACLQRPYIWRTILAEQIFGIPEHRFSVIAGDVGGSFGMKGGLYPEVPLVAWASRRAGRPVKWTCERSEGHISDDQARDMVIEAELGLGADGEFLGMRLSTINNVGAFVTMIGFYSTLLMPRAAAGVYVTPAVHGRAAAVLTNTVPVSNYRGPAGAPGLFALERMIDIAAREMDLDPAEIRRRNFIPPDAMPYRLAVDETYDSGEFEAVMDKCIALSDYHGASARKDGARGRGILRGIGIATIADPSASPSPETAELRFDPGGTVTVLVGTTAGGQSHATIFTQIVSDRLGIDSADIRVIEGDTDKLSWGTGTGDDRSTAIGGSAVFAAVDKVIDKSSDIAAHLLEAARADIAFEDGVFSVAGTDRTIGFVEVARAAFRPNQLPPDIEIGLYETATWAPQTNNTPNTCHVCEVEIDPDTGTVALVRHAAVHDVGVEINPLLVEGQIHGGIAQAVGEALMEDMVYDDDSGQVLSGSFMDYCMPRADDFCQFDIASHPVPSPTNPLGVKGAGECGTIGGLAAIMNAINDALAPLGIRNIAMPATPERIWRAIEDART